MAWKADGHLAYLRVDNKELSAICRAIPRRELAIAREDAGLVILAFGCESETELAEEWKQLVQLSLSA